MVHFRLCLALRAVSCYMGIQTVFHALVATLELVAARSIVILHVQCWPVS